MLARICALLLCVRAVHSAPCVCASTSTCDDGSTGDGCGCTDEFGTWCDNVETPCTKDYGAVVATAYRALYAEVSAAYYGTPDYDWFVDNVPDYEELAADDASYHYCRVAIPPAAPSAGCSCSPTTSRA